MSLVSYIARQPIVDTRGRVQGYELLYRDAAVNVARFDSDEQATASVLATALSTIGLDVLTEGRAAYINFNERMLVEGFSTILPPDKVVLELLEGVEFTPQLHATCLELREKGYRLALDDYALGSVSESFLGLVDLVKLDVQVMDGAIPMSVLKPLEQRKIELLAEKVETWEAFQTCKDLGCTLFQGYYFAHPEVMRSEDLQPAQSALLDALRLVGMDAELRQIELPLSRDTGLIYKILRYVNAAAFTRHQQIESLHAAFVMLGRDRLRLWLSLLLYATADKHPAAHVLMDTARLRSTLMGVCGEAAGVNRAQCNEAQVVGSFSLLDALLHRPLEDLVGRLALPQRMSKALLERSGPYGKLLRLVELLEGPWQPEIAELAREIGLDSNRLGELQIQAMSQASGLLNL